MRFVTNDSTAEVCILRLSSQASGLLKPLVIIEIKEMADWGGGFLKVKTALTGARTKVRCLVLGIEETVTNFANIKR